MGTSKPGVSVIICTFNGSARLVKTLNALSSQKFDSDLNCELLVVDNKSTDDSVDLVYNTWSSLGSPFPLKIIKESRPGKAYALETGYDNASFSYMITCDDDNWLQEGYFQNAFDLMNSLPTVGLLGCNSIGEFEVPPPAWFTELSEGFVVGKQAPVEGYFDESKSYVWGAGMVFRKSIWDFLRANNFEFITGKAVRKAVGEDSELSLIVKYLGYRFYYSESLVLKHWMPKERISWSNCISLYKGFGYTKPYFSFYNLFLKPGKWSKIGIHLYWVQLLSVYLYRIVRIWIKSWFKAIVSDRQSERDWIRLKLEERKYSVRELFLIDFMTRVYFIRNFTDKLKQAKCLVDD